MKPQLHKILKTTALKDISEVFRLSHTDFSRGRANIKGEGAGLIDFERIRAFVHSVRHAYNASIAISSAYYHATTPSGVYDVGIMNLDMFVLLKVDAIPLLDSPHKAYGFLHAGWKRASLGRLFLECEEDYEELEELRRRISRGVTWTFGEMDTYERFKDPCNFEDVQENNRCIREFEIFRNRIINMMEPAAMRERKSFIPSSKRLIDISAPEF